MTDLTPWLRICLALASSTLLLGSIAAEEFALSDELRRKLEMTDRKEHGAVMTRALTWLTGGAEENDYVSVGRLANYFGFVRLRIMSGHSLSRGSLGQEVYSLLDPQQRALTRKLLDDQWSALERCKAARRRVNRLLEGMLTGESATEALLVALAREFGAREAELGFEQALGFSHIIATLTAGQREALIGMRARALAGGGSKFKLKGKVRRDVRQIEGLRGQELWNLTSRLLSWVTGSPEDNRYDTAGKPSQHFGFVSLRMESGHGVTRGGIRKEVEEILAEPQEAALREVVPANRPDFDEFFRQRALISHALEAGLRGEEIDREAVLERGELQGEAEAHMTWRQARAFLALRKTMTLQQADQFVALRERFQIPDPTAAESASELEFGRRTYALCALCHGEPGGKSPIGPSLAGIVGRRAASLDGFPYSPALLARGKEGLAWTAGELDAFLRNPQLVVPGTSMGFKGLDHPEQRRSLIAFLGSLGPSHSPPVRAAATRPDDSGPEDDSPAATAPAKKMPNIILLVSDDQGFEDIGDRDSVVKTPALTELASEGVRFDRFYSYPTCSTTRSALMTGLCTARTGVNNRTGLPRHLPTMPASFRAAGYQTWMCGKWHLGGPEDNSRSGSDFMPHNRGFDHFYGFLHGACDYYEHTRKDTGQLDWQRNGKDVVEEGFSTDLFVEEAITMLRGRDRQRPVFLYVAFNAVHGPLSTPPSGTDLYSDIDDRKRQKLLANLTHMDTAIGRLLAEVDAQGMRDDTIVLFMSDNGGQLSQGASNGALRGEKSTFWEGGIRVPAMMRWPGVLERGQRSDLLLCVQDLFPTLATAAGFEPVTTQEFDGRDLWVAIRNGEQVKPEGVVVASSAGAVFDGPWKLLQTKDRKLHLFRIEDDPGEQNDLAAENPRVVARLRQLLDEKRGAAPSRSRVGASPDRRRGRGGGKAGRIHGQLDEDGDGGVTLEELRKWEKARRNIDELFTTADSDADGELDTEEMGKLLEARKARKR